MHKQQEFLKLIDLLGNDILHFKNKSFLISGATGLIGSYLIDFLLFLNKSMSYGINISAISRSSAKINSRFRDGNVIVIEQDLNKPFEISNNYDYVIHAASNAHPVAFSLDPVGTMKTNLIGTINILDSIKDSKSKFLYISSGEIYGNNQESAFVEEDFGCIDTKIARSCYPESKRAAETLCMSYNQQYGVNVNVARLCYVYGATITEENSRADAQFLRKALAGENIVMKSEGLQRRTYCYVADAISAILFILLKGKEAQVYNVANPQSIASIKEYAQTLCDIAGVGLSFELPNDIEKQGYSKPADSILDAQKLFALGWQPLYNLEQGLRNTYEQKVGAASLC